MTQANGSRERRSTKGARIAVAAEQQEEPMPRAVVHRALTVVAVLTLAVPITATAVGGFDGPLFGLTTAPNGDLLVARRILLRR